MFSGAWSIDRQSRCGCIDVFQLDHALIHDYEQFARSFTEIQATDIRSEVEAEYAGCVCGPDASSD